MQTKPVRNPAMDIVRCVALCCVIGVHFFLNNGYYDQTMAGARMYVMTLMRCFFMICVPLFMMLSGYLLKNKTPQKSYYGKLFKTLWIYVLAGACCTAYAVLAQGEPFKPLGIFSSFLNFSAAPYGWYIEMYIGLFLMIPFLNAAYNHLPSRKWKLVLIATGIVLTALPGVINVYDFKTPGFWQSPNISLDYQRLIPQWWNGVYPLTYYFIGCYFREYGFRLKRWALCALIAVTTLLYGSYVFWRCHDGLFIWGKWCDWGSLFNVVQTTLVFAFLANGKYERTPRPVAKTLAFFSELCLGAYLVSWIFDQMFYPILASRVPDMPQRLNYFFVIVPLVLLCSFALSFVINSVYRGGAALCRRLCRKTK